MKKVIGGIFVLLIAGAVVYKYLIQKNDLSE